MDKITVTEAFQFIHSYIPKAKKKDVEQWLKEDPVVQADLAGTMDEGWMYRFNDWCRFVGTAYELNIDPQIKINRLLDEIDCLKQEIEDLKDKNSHLKKQLGLDSF